MKTRERWELKGNVRKEGERKELASEKLHSSEYMQSYMRKMKELLGGTKVGIGDSIPVSEVSEIFKKSLIQGLEEVVGYKMCCRGKKGTAWCTQETKITVEEKRKSYKKMLQGCVPEEVKER